MMFSDVPHHVSKWKLVHQLEYHCGADVILDAMGYGPNTLKEMEAFIEKYNDAKPGSYLYRRVKRIKKALPYMRQIQPT